MVRFLLTGVFVLALASPAVAQQDGEPVHDLVGAASTTIDVIPDERAIAVTHEYRFENATTDDFTGFFETLPEDAIDVAATSAGDQLTTVGIPARDGFFEWLVQFPEPLSPGQARDVTLTWRLEALNAEPNDLAHVSPDVVALSPFAVEQRGETSLRVVVPGTFEVVEAAGYVVTEVEGETVLEVADPEAYRSMPFVLEAPDRFARTTLDTSVADITLATANGPSSWFADDLRGLVGGLAALIPLEPPAAVEFRQGYTGGAPYRQAADGALVLPFAADAQAAARVFADVWLAPIDFEDESLAVALSSALADRVATDAALSLPPRSGAWTSALDALVSVSDEATLGSVIAALDVGLPAYTGATDDLSDTPVDWRRLLDVFQHVGGVQAAPAAMRLSATGDQLVELDRRDAALADYDALAERAAPWAMPPMLSAPMAAWDFDSVAARQGSVSDLVLARDEMVTAAAGVDLEIGPYVQAEFERSTESADAAWELLIEQRATLDVVAEALRLDLGDRGLLSSLGMWGRGADASLGSVVDRWNAGEFDAAAEGAESLIEDYEASVGRGTLRLAIPLAGLIGLVPAAQAVLRRVRRQALDDA